MDRGVAAQAGPIAHLDVTTEHHTVREYDTIANHAIMSDVSADHNQAIITDLGFVTFMHGAMDGDVLANCVAVANANAANALGGARMLWQSTDDSAFADYVI
jgi:hypothetical protein